MKYSLSRVDEDDHEVVENAGAPVLGLAGCPGSDRIVYIRDDAEGVPELVVKSSDTSTTITRQDPTLVAYDSIALSVDGLRLVTVDSSPSSIVIVWDLATAEPTEIARAKLPTAGPYTASVCPENMDLFALVSPEHILKWKLEFSGDLTALNNSEARVQVSTRITRRGSLLGKMGRRNSVTSMLHLDKYIHKGRTNAITAHCWSEDFDIYVGTDDGCLYLTDGNQPTARELRQFLVQDIGAMSSIVRLTSGILVVAGDGAKARWVDPSNRFDVIREISFPDTPTFIMPISGGEDDVLACGNGFAHATSGDAARPLTNAVCRRTVAVGIVGTADQGHVAVSVGIDGSGCLWDCLTGAHRGTIAPPEANEHVSSDRTVTVLACSPVSGFLLVGWSDGSLTGYDVRSEESVVKPQFSLPVLPSAVACIAIDDTASLFCVAGQSLLAVFDAANVSPLGSLSFEGSALALDFETSGSGDIRHLVILHGSNEKKTLTGLMLPASLARMPRSLEKSVHKSVPAPQNAVAITVTWNSVLLHIREDDIITLDWATFEVDEKSPKLPGHVFASEIHAASAAGRVVATCGSDGVVFARFLRDQQSSVEPAVGIGHRPTLIGPSGCSVGISNDGQFILSAGGDGEVILWMWAEAAHSQSSACQDLRTIVAESAARAAQFPAIRGSHHVRDIEDALATDDSQSTKATAMSNSEETKALARKVAKLRTKVMSLVEQNETKPELEQLDREEFQLDLAEQKRLLKEGENAMTALKEEIELKILAQQFLRHQIKKMCWDAMEVRGLAVYTYDGKLEVSNYPLPKRSIQDIQELRKVQFARKVELEVARKTQSRAGLPPADDDDEDHEDSLLYSHLELRSDIKKRCQVVLLRDSILQTKKDFNQKLKDVWADKLAESEKIKRKNEDIRKVVAEMKLGGTEAKIELFEPTSQPLENPDDLLTIKDEEITVPRVLNEEERAAAAEQEREAEERRKLAELDNPRERGLVDMMDGKLEGKGLEEIWQDLPEPAFMTQTLSDTWTDAQKFTAEKYRAELAEREDMREKRRKALLTELGNLQEAVKTARKNFDTRVEELFFYKIRTQQKILQQELKIVLLLRSLQYESSEQGNERDLTRDLHKIKAKLPAAAEARKQAAAALEIFRAEHATLDKADKLLDRRFKMRMRDYPEAEPHADHLFKLFKKRHRRRSSVSMLATTADSLAPPLDPDVDRPEGISDDLWDRVVELREEKIQSEIEVNRSALELNHREAFTARRESEEEGLVQTVETILDDLDASQQKRFEGATDVEILVSVKQGQMEVNHVSDFEPNYEDTVLIPNTVIEDLNNQVVGLGNIKIEHLRSVMQLRTAVHVLEWENKRLRMVSDDHTTNTKAVQLLRVTKDLVQDEGVSLAERHRRENEVLEKSIEKLQQTLQKTVAQRKKTIREIQAKRKNLAREEEELKPGYDDLKVAVQEREVVHKVFVANRGPDLVRQRLKDAALKRRLKNTMQTQQEEIMMLEGELERLRMRTFPAFAPGQRAPF